MRLYPHQKELLERTKDYSSAGYFVDMGLGKTYVGSEKMRAIGNPLNLLVCQKSKVDDWREHFEMIYPDILVRDLTKPGEIGAFVAWHNVPRDNQTVGIINYELLFRRPEMSEVEGFTLILDESSLIQNENAKRSSFILKKLRYSNVVLLSGTVVNGNYERLWSQCQLLGWPISKDLFNRQYMTWKTIDVDGFTRKVRTGYKNIDRLKTKLADYGAVFLKTDEVFSLPEQTFIDVFVPTSAEYRHFLRTHIVEVDDRTLIGDMQLTDRLYKRLLCGAYSKEKIQAFSDLVESTTDRLVVFYNFDAELYKLIEAANNPHMSFVNGSAKDLFFYENVETSITFVQYQAGAMGLNLQKANKIIYYTLPDGGSELFEQSKKRIHRIGQTRPCFYYMMTCQNSIEDEEIIPALEEKRERIDDLFVNGKDAQ